MKIHAKVSFRKTKLMKHIERKTYQVPYHQQSCNGHCDLFQMPHHTFENQVALTAKLVRWHQDIESPALFPLKQLNRH